MVSTSNRRSAKGRSAPAPARTARQLNYAGAVSLEMLQHLVPLLAQVIGPNCEVVLHDFSKLPNSIVAIGGSLTQRTVGGTINPFTLEKIREGADQDLINYQVQLPDGRMLRSSTIFICNDAGEPSACLCVNFDVSDWLRIRALLDTVTIPYALDALPAPPATALPTQDETFPHTVDDMMVEMVSTAIARVGVPLDLMHKRHKVEVVRILEKRGLFIIRDGVDFAARELHVTRYTIYNYLNEIKTDQVDDAPA